MDRPDDTKPPHRALSDTPDIASVTLQQLEEDMLLPGILYESLRQRCHATHDKGDRCGVGLLADHVCPCGRSVPDGVGSATCFWLNDVVNKANAVQFLEAVRALDAKLADLERATLAPEPPARTLHLWHDGASTASAYDAADAHVAAYDELEAERPEGDPPFVLVPDEQVLAIMTDDGRGLVTQTALQWAAEGRGLVSHVDAG